MLCDASAAWRSLLGMRKRLRGWFSSLNVVAAPPPPLSQDLRRQLQREFEDDVRELGELIGRDLSGWSVGDGKLVSSD